MIGVERERRTFLGVAKQLAARKASWCVAQIVAVSLWPDDAPDVGLRPVPIERRASPDAPSLCASSMSIGPDDAPDSEIHQRQFSYPPLGGC